MIKKHKRSDHSSKYFTVSGVNFATCCSGTKYKNRDDLLLIVLDPGSSICACFTVSTMPSAPVVWSKKNVRKNQNFKQKLVLLVNAGNANAFTGEQGLIACEKKARALSNLFQCEIKNIFFSSTGVIELCVGVVHSLLRESIQAVGHVIKESPASRDKP